MPPAWIVFTSPSLRQEFTYYSPGDYRVAGTPLNGTWEFDVPFPQYSEVGTWKVSLVFSDTAWNQARVSTADLIRLGVPSGIDIFRPYHAPDTSFPTSSGVGPLGGWAIDEVFWGQATITFPPGAVSSPTQVTIIVRSIPADVIIPSGYSPASLLVNYTLEPIAAMPFAAPGVTLTVPLRSQKTPGTVLQLFRVDPLTGGLVPAVSMSGGDVFGVVDVDGLCATFTGVTKLSSVAALQLEKVPGDVNGDGAVDCADMAIVKASFGKRSGQAGFDARADLNSDRLVNVLDLALVSRRLPAGTRCL